MYRLITVLLFLMSAAGILAQETSDRHIPEIRDKSAQNASCDVEDLPSINGSGNNRSFILPSYMRWSAYGLPLISLQGVSVLPSLTYDSSTGIMSSGGFFLSPVNISESYRSLGEYRGAGLTLGWTPSPGLGLDFSVLAARGFLFSSPLARTDMAGAMAGIHYGISPRVSLDLWGRYMSPGCALFYGMPLGMFPTSGAGATLSVDVDNGTAVDVNAEYMYDNVTRTWNMKSTGSISVKF